MEKKENELVVETRGYCFLCLNQINLITELDENKENSGCVHSMQCLSKYLKLDMRKVFQGPVPHKLLEKVERSKLKVELCSECSSLNAKLSELFDHLERIEMDIIFRLGILSGKISCSEESGKMELIRNKLENSIVDLNKADLMGKLEIAQVLREETNRKCSLRLNIFNSIPKVKIVKTEWKKPIYKGNRKAFTTGNGSESVRIDIGPNKEIKTEILSYPTEEANNTDDNFQQVFEDDNYGHQSPLSSSESNSAETVPIKSESVSWTQRKCQTISSHVSNKMKGKKVSITEGKNLTIVPPPIKSGPAGTASICYFLTKSFVNPENGCHQCRICSKEYSHSYTFSRHFKSGHMKVSYACPAPVCGKSFSHKHHYERHYQNVHLRIRYGCKICKKTFTLKQHLVSHVKRAHS